MDRSLFVFVMGSAALLIQQYADFYESRDLECTLTELTPDLSLPVIQTYDFIVVGGGSSGCFLAERLSERFTVLLIEAGGTPPPATDNPAFTDAIAAHPAINNAFTSVAEQHTALLAGGIITETTGRMLGGSGSHNRNIFNRGSPRDYNAWAELTNDSSWEYNNVLQHFKRFENFVGSLINESQRNEFYGTGGPITVDTDTPPQLQTWLDAGAELGFAVGDPNGYQRESFTPFAKSIWNGERVSSYNAMVKKVEGIRSSLTVLRYSVAEQILIDNSGIPKANGVRYRRHGIPQIAYASREVIISCGTLQSPLLLIKSGIGPRELLNSIRISVVSDVPGVGARFMNQPNINLPFVANNAEAYDAIFPAMRTNKDVAEQLNLYQNAVNRAGGFTYFRGPQAFLVSNEAKSRGEIDWPDVEINIFRNVQPTSGIRDLTIAVLLGRKESIGRLVFNTNAFLGGETSDAKLMLVDHNYFSVPADLNAIIDGILLSFRVLQNTTAFHPLNITYVGSTPAACTGLEFGSVDYWKCVIPFNSGSATHMTSTCKMGILESDSFAVVDSELRVRGVRGLRVVDASVLPFPPNAHSNAAVLLVAEKSAVQILSENVRKGDNVI